MKRKAEKMLPMKLLEEVQNNYPNIFSLLDNYSHNVIDNRCTLSTGILKNVLDKYYLDPSYDTSSVEKQMRYIMSLGKIETVYSWRRSKELYTFDAELIDSLSKDVEDLSVFKDVLKRLPYNTFYIKFDHPDFTDGEIDGAFVSFIDDTKGEVYLHIAVLYPMDDLVGYDPFYIKIRTMDWKNDSSVKSTIDYLLYKEVSEESIVEKIGTQRNIVMLVLNMILYIVSANADIVENESQKRIMKRGPIIKDKFSEIRKWDVGVRVGSAIRKHKAQLEDAVIQEDTNEENLLDVIAKRSGTPKRPHMRCGHFHHYWTGKRNGERKLIVKWVAPTFIGKWDKDLPVVVHK